MFESSRVNYRNYNAIMNFVAIWYVLYYLFNLSGASAFAYNQLSRLNSRILWERNILYLINDSSNRTLLNLFIRTDKLATSLSARNVLVRSKRVVTNQIKSLLTVERLLMATAIFGALINESVAWQTIVRKYFKILMYQINKLDAIKSCLCRCKLASRECIIFG